MLCGVTLPAVVNNTPILNIGIESILHTPLCTAVCCVGQALYAIVINAHSQHRSILSAPLCTAVCCVGQTLYAIVINAHSQHR